MEDYKSNSDKARQEQSEKKVEAVITGAAKTRKKGEMQKFADVFIAEDANNVKSYILMEVIVPAVKKAISDIVTTGIDMILYGEAGRSKKNGTASKVSYRNYYDQGTDRVHAGSVGNRRNTPDYDDMSSLRTTTARMTIIRRSVWFITLAMVFSLMTKTRLSRILRIPLVRTLLSTSESMRTIRSLFVMTA